MPITTYNTTYFDDFNIKDIAANNKTVAEKNYLRILFKPGYSVQVRELNQLQSILQSQIDRLGSSVYKDGSAVIGGNCTFDNNIFAIDVSVNSTVDFSQVTIISTASNSTGLTAKLLGYKSITSTSIRLYIRYNNSIQNGVTGQNISVFPTNGSIFVDTQSSSIGSCTSNLYAAGAFLDEGVFYTKGSFVWTPKQSVFLDKALQTSPIDQLIVLSVTEAVVNYSFDDTLKDNVTGSSNYSAPGADRYTIDLALEFMSEGSIGTSNYIRLLTIKNSQCLDTIKKIYTSLDDVLAKRTYEESGDYTLSPFKITLREFYNNGSNNGRYTPVEMPSGSVTSGNEIADGEKLYSISLDPAVAYIKGYRVELTQARDLYASKSRANPETNILVHSSARVGNYVIGEFQNSSVLPTITNPTTEYNIYSVTNTDPPVGGDKIGTCKLRAVDGTDPTAIRLHLFDISITDTKYLTNAKRIYHDYGGSVVDFKISPTPTSLSDSAYTTGLFPIPYGTTRKVSQLSYVYDALVSGSFGTTDTTFSAPRGIFADSSSIICIDNSSNVLVLSGTGGGTGTITIAGHHIISAILPIRIDEPDSQYTQTNLKSKTIKSAFVSSTVDSATRVLPHGDVIKITSVLTTPGGLDVTSLCSISDDGQRDNYYTNSSILYTGVVTDDLVITYEYFEHGAGDYFTISSYPDTLLYDDVPSYKGVRLSDVYDFRPLVLAGDSGVTYTPLDPDSVITSVIDYYLPKIDTVIVDSNGIFSVIEGDTALEPKASIVPANAMALYTLNVPAYTYSPKDITVNYIDNRRFTMRDIGGIDKRIANIEYYTSLSLLETSAQNASIIDVDGQRLKNGYIVDAFTGHSVGDPANAGYACSMDTSVGLLRPKFSMKNLRLIPSNTSNVKVHAHTITMPYTEKVLINQSHASDTLSVNPYDVAVFAGNISLMPSSDNWKDTLHAPDLIINNTGAYDAVALTASTSDTFGLHWNEWQTNWLGKITVTGRSAITAATGFSGAQINKAISATTTTSYQSRTGTITSLGYTDQTQSLGNRAIDISYIPYIRPRKIYFSATKLKPNTRLFAFFDGINVTDYCNQLTNIPSSINSSTDTAVYYNSIPSEDLSHLTFKMSTIISDEFGNVQGEFIIPNNKVIKFKCGQRIFKLTDSASNTESESTTVADNQYIASGTTETQQETILSIRKPELVVTSINQNQAVNTGVVIQWNDPLAQTFMIPSVEEGLYATGFDLFFASKSDNLPVTAYIVLVSNGIPTQQIMPFSTVTKQAGDIVVDPEKGSIKTEFKFSDPVYLLNGTEYAIVVTSNSADYRIWVASVGGVDVATNTAITKNVYNGVLLMSQNASTWTPEQTKDMKFVMHYAEFDTTPVTVEFTKHMSGGIDHITSTITDTYSGGAPTFTIAPPGTPATSGTITITSGTIVSISVNPGAGYSLPPLVTIQGDGKHAKAHANINGAGAVTEIVIDNPGSGYTIGNTTVAIDPPGVTATAIANINPDTNKISGIIITNPGSGYTSAPTVTLNPVQVAGTATAVVDSIDVSLFNLNRNAVAVNKTMISDSLDMNAITYPAIIANENYAADSQFSFPTGSIVLKTKLSSDSSYLSPVIDLERNSLICVNNIIGEDPALVSGVYSSGADTELSSDSGNTIARYITRTIALNNASDRVDIYINVNRPIAGSNIRVYVKYDDSTKWNLYNPDIQIPISSDPASFTEIHYTDILSQTLFTSFAVKIVMISSTKTQVPTIKDFRAIATL